MLPDHTGHSGTQVEGLAAEVSGRLPPWLAGSFLRNGPGNYDGMLHVGVVALPLLAASFLA